MRGSRRRAARYRIFGAKPGTYGAGILPLIETRHWQTDATSRRCSSNGAATPTARGADGVDARDVFVDRLRTVEVAVHNQDNREHDIFDSDDYYQFHGGMIATVRALTGRQPKAYFGDSSRPDAARVRDLREEALRVFRSRVVNPKWIDSIAPPRLQGRPGAGGDGRLPVRLRRHRARRAGLRV